MPTILIVEDNEDIRLNLVEYLESKNYQTDNTDDGLKALALTIVNKYAGPTRNINKKIE